MLAALLGAGGATLLWWLSPAARRHLQLPRLRWAGGLLAGVAYAWLSGWGVPAQRSLLMLTSFAVPALVRRRSHPFDNYGRALIFVLLFDPLAPISVGFWLSFAAVLALLALFGGRWRLGRRRQLESLAVVSVILAPLTLTFFGSVSLLAPLANMVAIPWVSTLVAPGAMPVFTPCRHLSRPGLGRGWPPSIYASSFCCRRWRPWRPSAGGSGAEPRRPLC